MTKENIAIMCIFIIYMLAMIIVGFFFSKKTSTNKEYVLGGRQLNPWVTAFSAQASDMSGWLLTGVPAMAFASYMDAKAVFFIILGLFMGTWLNWVLVAKRLRVYTEVASDSLTIPEYLVKRFDDKKGILGLIAGIIILLFFTVYTASMFSASAKLFSSVFGMDYRWGLLIGVVLVVSYTFLGGFKAVSWTDLIQGMIMFFALILVPIYVYAKMQQTEQTIVTDYIIKVFSTANNGDIKSITIVSSLGWAFGYFGMPHILVRFMAIKDKNAIKPARIIAIIWVAITMCAAVMIGLVGRGLFDPNAIDKETVFMLMVKKSFGPVLSGILLTAVLAAIMSTADSQLLVAASAFSTDIFKKHIKKDSSDKLILNVSRITILCVALLAVGIAYDENSKVFDLVSYAWGGFGASFGPVILFSLYSKKIKKSGVIASMVTGALTTVIFKYGLSRFGGFWTIYEIIPGFILASIALWVVSLLDKNTLSEQVNSDYDKFIKRLHS